MGDIQRAKLPPKVQTGEELVRLGESVWQDRAMLAKAVEMWDAGMSAGAVRQAQCLRIGWVKQCKAHHHLWHFMFRCGLRFCLLCMAFVYESLFYEAVERLVPVAERLVPEWPVVGHCPRGGGSGEVRVDRASRSPGSQNFAIGSLQSDDLGALRVSGHGENASSIRVSVILPAQGQQVSERREVSLARRRLQRGQLYLYEGVKEAVWYERHREDVIEEGKVRRIYHNTWLGTLEEFPTRKLAQRGLDERLRPINAPGYRARPTARFADFAARWEGIVLVQHKPSTQPTIRSQVRKYLNPFFGRMALRDIQAEDVQRFVSGVQLDPKTVRNLFTTLQMIWKSARAWGYVAHDPLDGVVLPKRRRPQPFSFTVEEIQRILAAAEEPYRTFYRLAAETMMRAGELCGLRVEDFEVGAGVVKVGQSVWRGRIQEPKTENAHRAIMLSPQFVEHLKGFLRSWRPNERRLLFATSRGTPWDAGLVVKRKLRPLLRSLGIREAGLHAFRHGIASLMDRLGVPLKVRQQRGGWSDPRFVLQTYTHADVEDQRPFAEQLGRILNRNEPKSEEEGVACFEQPQVVH